MLNRDLSSKVDLLIIGAGPAGLAAAAWAKQFNIVARIIDKNSGPVPTGQADGLQARTLEILDSFGLVDRVWRAGFHDIELNTWLDEDGKGIVRTERVLSQKKGISRFSQTCVNQAIIEETFNTHLDTEKALPVERNVIPQELLVDEEQIENNAAYPITVRIQHLGHGEPALKNINGPSKTHFGNESDWDRSLQESQKDRSISREETIHAKYVVACDGAHSWTRRQLRLPMEGEQTEHVWGVMDTIPLSNFPDMRQACAIHSKNAGSILSVPREGRLNRMYIQLGLEDNVHNRNQVNERALLAAAQRIMKPYSLDFKYCDWWSLYKIGQRVSPRFSAFDSVFLAGDAVHTHSPKLGQGMNVSMQDSYNLLWKICAVITGKAKPVILATYETERRKVALELLQCDREIARFYTRSKHSSSDSDASERVDFGKMRERMHGFLAGVGIAYSPSILVARSPDCEISTSHADGSNGTLPSSSQTVTAIPWLAKNITVGARMPSYKILNQAEARPVHLADLLKSDGRWRLLVFAGNIKLPAQARRIEQLGRALDPTAHTTPPSILTTFTPPTAPIDSVIDVLTIHSAPRTEVELLRDFPAIFHPYDDDRGWDYWKVYVDDEAHHEGFADAYRQWGIADGRQATPENDASGGGCLVLLRPDQHVAYIGELEDVEQVRLFLDGCLVAQQ